MQMNPQQMNPQQMNPQFALKIVPYEIIMSKESEFDNEEFAGREQQLQLAAIVINKMNDAIWKVAWLIRMV